MLGASSINTFGSMMYSLSLSNNDLSGEFPKFPRGASHLGFLDLSYNRFFGTLPEWLPGKMQDLEILRLRSNMFNGHIPDNLTCIVSLHNLDISLAHRLHPGEGQID